MTNDVDLICGEADIILQVEDELAHLRAHGPHTGLDDEVLGSGVAGRPVHADHITVLPLK